MKKSFITLLGCLLLALLTSIESKAQLKLINYWDFKNANNPSNGTGGVQFSPYPADYSKESNAWVVYKKVPGDKFDSAILDNYDATDPYPADSNSRPGYGGCCTYHYSVRARNPSDSMQLLWYIPTKRYRNIIIKYITEISSTTSGQLAQLYSYSIDSGATWLTTGLSSLMDSTGVKAWHLDSINMSSITGANNTGKLVFRIKFRTHNTGTSGNNRFTNVTVEGDTVPSLSVTDSVIANVSCNGLSNGNATAKPIGGFGPFTYSWSNGSTSNPTGPTLSAGTYTVTVTDNYGTTATASVSITQPGVLTTTASVVAEVSCNGSSNGNASTTTAGGTGPYTYSWSNGSTVVAISNPSGAVLTAGSYTVTVTDGNGCTDAATINVTEPTALTTTISSTHTSCGGNTGTADVKANGGVPSYTYSWSTGSTSSSISSLSAGFYSVTVTDNNGCTTTTSVAVTTATGPHDSITSIINNLCNGDNKGRTTVGVAGGTPPYTYSWNNGESAASDSLLTQGTYTVIVTDSAGCATVAVAKLTDPAKLVDTITSLHGGCIGNTNGTVNVGVIGGTMPYTYSWSTSPIQTSANATGLSAGTYTLMVTDSNKCTASLTCTIVPGPIISFNLGSDSIKCDTIKSFLLTSYASPSGGTFSGKDVVGNIFNPFAAGVGKYTIKYHFTNIDGCTDSASQTLRVDTCSVTGIAQVQQKENSIVIYPNPNAGEFSLSGLTKGSILELYNEMGMLIFSTRTTEESMSVNIANKPNGIYLMRVISGSKTNFVRKVIKL